MERQNNLNKINMANNEHQDGLLQNEVLEQMKSERNHYYHEYCKLKNHISGFATDNDICHLKCPHAQLEHLLLLINQEDSKETAIMEEELQKTKEMCSEIEETRRKIRQKLDEALGKNAKFQNERKWLELLLEQTEKTLRDTQDSKCSLESELAIALNQLQTLIKDNIILKKEILTLKETNIPNKNTMMETESCSNVQLHLQKQESFVEQINRKVLKLQENVKLRLNELQKCYEDNVKRLAQQIKRLKLERSKLRHDNDSLIWDNGELQDYLSSRTDELLQTMVSLKRAQIEVQDLKRQLPGFTSEEQNPEESIMNEDSEWEELLQLFKGPNHKPSLMENSEHTSEKTIHPLGAILDFLEVLTLDLDTEDSE